MNDGVQAVGDMDWSGQGRTAPIDCRMVLVANGTTRAGLAHQKAIVAAANTAGFEVQGLAVKRAQSTADYHRTHMDQSEDATAEPTQLRSGIELAVRHAGPFPETANAVQALVDALPNALDLVNVSVGRGGDDYFGNDVVVIN